MLHALLFVTSLSLAAASAPPPAPQHIPSRLITLDEALHLASTRHPEVLGQRHAVHSAVAASRSVRGRLLPRLDVTDMQLWSWATPSLSPNVLPGLNPAALGHAPKDVTANVLAVSVSQPLLGLAHLSQDYAATRHQARAEQQTFDATLAALRAEVRSKLLSLFKARALTRTAVSSQQSLEEQVEDARQEAEAGALAPADVLRMEAAAANAKQQVIASQAQAESLHADLLEMLDLADGPDGIDFVEPPTADVDVSGLAALPTLRAQALEQRPELHAQSHLAQAAAKSAAAKGWALWPEINAQLAYGHVFGQPMGVPGSQGSLRVNALTVMLSGKWAVWEWGASAYAQRQAQHGARAAHARAEAARRRVGSEVAARHAALVASASAIDVAQAQVTSAEEAFRVMQASRSAGSATTTDLLQAEAMRTQARMNLVSARYDTLLAHVALQRALGADTVMDNLPKP